MSFSSSIHSLFWTALTFPFFVLAAAFAPASNWTVQEPLNIPRYHYGFLAATPQGDLLATTFNSTGKKDDFREMPAVVVRNPMSANPEVQELARVSFGPYRGYGGIACDQQGNFYLTGDTGDPTTCFLMKFLPDGQTDARFGNGGIVRPMRRALGLDIVGDYLLMAVDWGEIIVVNARTGEPQGMVPQAPGVVYVRDIAIDPKSMRIFGVAQGGVVTWGRGAPWSTMGYRYRALTPTYGTLRSGEGISIDPIRRSVLIIPQPGNVLYEIFGDGSVEKTVITTASPEEYLTDSALSFDGTTLFVSDVLGMRIHALSRPASSLAAGLDARAGAPSGREVSIRQEGSAKRVTWHRSYTQIVRSAREQKRPMIVYFGLQDIPKCREVQENLLLTDTFNQHAQDFVCVYEDVGVSRLMAYRMGAFRVPFIVVLDAEGETVAEYSFDIDVGNLFDTMDKLSGASGDGAASRQ